MELLQIILLLLSWSLSRVLASKLRDDINDMYTVVLHKNHTITQHFEMLGLDLSHEDHFHAYPYNRALGGPKQDFYSVKITDDDLLQALREHASVQIVQRDEPIDLDWNSVWPAEDSPLRHRPLMEQASYSTQSTPPVQNKGQQSWKRDDWYNESFYHNVMLTYDSDSKAGGLEYEAMKYNYQLMNNPLAGRGVDIYIFDSGVFAEHVLFRDRETGKSRVEHFGGLNATAPSPYCNGGVIMNETNPSGHGTLMAGVAGGVDTGLAPGSTLVNVKIECGPGNTNYNLIVQAIEDVTAAHQQKLSEKPPGWKGSVLNFSGNLPKGTSWFYSSKVLSALDKAFRAGIPIAAAAGNNGEDASYLVPCSAGFVFCVGAVDKDYNRWITQGSKQTWSSNWGPAVNILAPGKSIGGPHIGGDGDPGIYTYNDGTSASSAMIAGIMSIFPSYEVEGTFGAPGSTETIYRLVRDNGFPDLANGFPQGDGSVITTRLFASTGINHPAAHALDPYVKDREELRRDIERCQLNITEIWTCESAEFNKYVRVSVADGDGNHIYSTPESEEPAGISVVPFTFQLGGMTRALTMQANRDYDYIMISIEPKDGAPEWDAWTASNQDPSPWMQTGQCWLFGEDWDADAGPRDCPNSPRKPSLSRQFVCKYPCY